MPCIPQGCLTLGCTLLTRSRRFYTAAAVCQKLQAYDRALEYIDAALSRDLDKAGTLLPISRVSSQILRGHILASLERLPDAGKALETAAAEAHQYGVRLYEAQALLELKLCVLDHIGHSEHGSRRLGAALRKLKGPAAKLSQLLKGGLDASELMALPVPDAGYRVVYEAAGEADGEESSVVALREELHGLRLKELRKRFIFKVRRCLNAHQALGSLLLVFVRRVTPQG